METSLTQATNYVFVVGLQDQDGRLREHPDQEDREGQRLRQGASRRKRRSTGIINLDNYF